MKLFVLPLLARPLLSSTSKLPLYHLYAQKLPNSTPPKITLLQKALDKAAHSWSALNNQKTGPINSIKRKIYVTGDKLMDKIDFEEWSLKSIEVSTAPALWSDLEKFSNADGQKWKDEGRKPLERVKLLYPASILDGKALKSEIKSMLLIKEPFHKNQLIKMLIISPFTLPFAIVPLVPNLPLFYVLWRAYSHYKAYKATQYLTSLFSTSQIHFLPSPYLDSLYPPPTPSTKNSPILSSTALPSLAKEFTFGEEDTKAIERAILQAGLRLEKEAIAKEGGDEERVERRETVEAVKSGKDA